MPIGLVIGAGSWGLAEPDQARDFAAAIRKYRSIISTIDTAALYPLPNPGASEKAIGEAGFADEGYVINTKALYLPQGGCYNAEGVQRSVSQSLQSLKIAKVNVLYTHAPDKKTPIAEQAAAFNDSYEKGKFSYLGVANLDAEMLKEWISVADSKGFVKPSVYQGQYNLLCRAHENGVFPVVRDHGMKFMAYSPLAGGFLSGAGPTFAPESALVGSRYEHCENNVNHGPFYRFWYDKEAMHTAVKTLKIAADSYGIDLAEVAIRWLVHHSALKDGDAIIIGPETAEELERSVNAYHGGPLPEELVETIDKLQDIVREDAKTIIQF